MADTAPNRDFLKLERIYRATPEELWALWTTREGVESWWGPNGFAVTVESLDLRPGGDMVYLMRATAPEMVAFMKANAMPEATRTRLTYDKVEAARLLAYRNIVDFVPGIAPYPVATRVSFTAVAAGTRMLLEFARMHDEVWTGRQAEGFKILNRPAIRLKSMHHRTHDSGSQIR